MINEFSEPVTIIMGTGIHKSQLFASSLWGGHCRPLESDTMRTESRSGSCFRHRLRKRDLVAQLISGNTSSSSMRAVIQRVSSASVTVDEEIVGQIGQGVCVLLGVATGDTMDDVAYMANKIVGLRIFEDDDGKMNRSLAEAGGAMLVVSQFTLYGDCRKGRRPSFVGAAGPEQGSALYEAFVEAVREQGITVETGRFRAMMDVALVNDGPVTLLVDSQKTF